MHDDLEYNRQRVLAYIAQAEHTAQRTPNSVRLVAVSKTFPAEDIRVLYQHNQYDFGENYIQEWYNKIKQLRDCTNIIWHMIGHVQSNKSRIVAEYAHWLHTLDSIKLATRLNAQRPKHLPPLNVLIEINIAQNPDRHGIMPAELLPLAQQVSRLPHLRLRGLMCVASNTQDQGILKTQFRQMYQQLQTLQNIVPIADTLSMGMSGDMNLAIECGTTMVRIGRAIFGKRNYSNET